jgi:hypothetical protein
MSSLITWQVARGRADELRTPQRSRALQRELLSDARARHPRRRRLGHPRPRR